MRYQVAFQHIYRNVNTMIKEHVHEDITTDQFIILQYIFNNQQITATQISQAFGVGKSAITAIINRLDNKQLIARKRNKQDRRIVYLSLTKKGQETVQETEDKINLYLEDKLAFFDREEIMKFLLAIERLAELMENTNLTEIEKE